MKKDIIKKKNSLFFRIRLILRRTQNGKIIPFVFIFSGLFDFLLMGQLAQNYVTFFVWLYIGIGGIILFFIEETPLLWRHYVP